MVNRVTVISIMQLIIVYIVILACVVYVGRNIYRSLRHPADKCKGCKGCEIKEEILARRRQKPADCTPVAVRRDGSRTQSKGKNEIKTCG